MCVSALSGAIGGVTNGLAAMGIAPESFNLSAHFLPTMKMAGAGAIVSAFISVCHYIQNALTPNTANPNGTP